MNTWKIALSLGVVALQPALSTEPPAPATAVQVYFEVGAQIEHANAALDIPHDAESILFDIGDDAEELSPHGHRVRYRLEGVDSDWRQKRDEVSFTVFFYNETGDQVGQRIYNMIGVSPGWNGSAEHSTFSPRHETLTVPPGAAHLGVVLSSAGPPTTVGIFIVDDIRIVQEAEGAGNGETITDSGPFLHGNGTAASGWIRTGRRPSMATLIPRPGAASPAKAFCILDDDPTSYAEWTSPWQNTPAVTPGRRLSIDWNEIYETGLVKWNQVAYPLPPPGHYRFIVQEVDTLGHPLPVKNEIEITVLPPFWKDPWFWCKCAGGAALVLFAGWRYRRHSRNRLRARQARLMEKERMRIARDLHDDLGARITHISLMSSFAGTDKSLTDPRAKFEEIATMARDLVASLSEVVWAVNPEKDRLESTVDHLCRLIQRLCQDSSLRCRIDEFTEGREYTVSSQVRHHVVLAVKEAVNNAIKHSEATELRVSIQFRAPLLIISIADNGKGLPADPSREGNGIANMRERIALLKGRIDITSEPGKGTRVLLEIPVS